MNRFFVSALGFSALVLAACKHTEAHSAPPEGPAVAVSIAPAHEEELPIVYRASGTVRGRNTTTLISKTTGYVRNVLVQADDRVTAGQLLVKLEANDVQAQVARNTATVGQLTNNKVEAENALAAARANAKIAKSSFDRAAQLLKDNAIPQQQFDEAEAQWHGAEAQEKAAQARVRAAGSGIAAANAELAQANATLGYADIVAPFAGRVLERRVDPGALAAPGTPLVVVSDEGGLRVEAAVEESYADDVKVGDDVNISIGTLAPMTGKVGEIVPHIDTNSRSFLVKVDLPPDAGALRPGTYAHVGFVVGSSPHLVVPTTAMTSLGALDRVFTVDSKRARMRMITRGETVGQWTEILSGLTKGDNVVVTPPPDLRDGMPVEVRP
ncbi:MAG: efflux RND transporter periplasmic adaptor subunit [Polyangiaceae bacterium]|nr:efflux RND transporter periplasmic adaptor subunit [Polyangiaceae bacterium]